MSRAAGPDREDVRLFLAAAKLQPTDALVAVLTGEVEAAVDDFQRDTDRIILAKDARTCKYDPPTNWREREAKLCLERDFATVDSVVYQPASASPATWTEGVHYDLLPYDAPADGKPYTHLAVYLRFLAPLFHTMRRSILVTGKVGYAEVWPANAFQAVLARAARRCYPQLAHAFKQGLVEWSDEDVKEKYGDDPLGKLRDDWDALYASVVGRYVRLEL